MQYFIVLASLFYNGQMYFSAQPCKLEIITIPVALREKKNISDAAK